MNKKALLILTVAFCLFFFSCTNNLFMDHMNYNQKTGSPDSSGGGNDGEDFDTDTDNPDGIKISANFKYILPNGEIDTINYKGGTAILPSQFSPAPSFKTQVLNDKILYLSVINGQVPAMHFKDGEWRNPTQETSAAKKEYIFGGEEVITITDVPFLGTALNEHVSYYKYQGKNPKYAPFGFYNTARFTRDDGFSETVMNRFNFYRWTGNNPSGQVDTYLLAVDTYTRLTFVAFKIAEGDWIDYMGQLIPNNFVPIEQYAAGDGVFYNFYEYDPCGYIDEAGDIILETWYKKNMSTEVPNQVALMPPRTGKSPYSTYENKEVITAGLIEGGAPVTGTFTIKPAITVTGTAEDTAKFELYSFWSNGSKNEEFKPDTLGIGETDLNTLGHKMEFAPKEYIANNTTTDMILLLGSTITHIYGNTESNINTFSAENAYKLTYNRLTQKWEHESGFSLGNGEERTIEIYVRQSKLTMTFVVKWENRDSATDRGRVLLAAVNYKGIDTQVEVTGYGSNYTIEYTDAHFNSAENTKSIELEITFYNLDDSKPITMYYQKPAGQNFVTKILFDGTNAVKRGGDSGITPVRLSMTLECNPQEKQQQVIPIKLNYPSIGFDMTYSPKEISITVKRSMK